MSFVCVCTPMKTLNPKKGVEVSSNKLRRPVSRVLSCYLRSSDGHFSRTAIARRLQQPTREEIGRTVRATQPKSHRSSLLGLAPGGVCRADESPRRWCALTAPFHPYRRDQSNTLTGAQNRGGGIFLLHFPGLTTGRCYRPPCPVEPGLSSRCNAASDRPACGVQSCYTWQRVPLEDQGSPTCAAPRWLTH